MRSVWTRGQPEAMLAPDPLGHSLWAGTDTSSWQNHEDLGTNELNFEELLSFQKPGLPHFVFLFFKVSLEGKHIPQIT